MLICVFGTLAAVGPSAQEKNPGSQGTDSLLTAQGRIALDAGGAVLNLTGGYTWLTPAQTKELFETKWGNQNFEPGMGAILPPGFSPDGEGVFWLVLVRWHPSGRVADAAALRASDLWTGLKKLEKQRNEKRQGEKLAPVVLRGWALEPQWNEAQKSLAWSVEWQIGGDSAYDFHVAVLGREGWLDLQYMVSAAEIGRAKDSVPILSPMVSFSPGHRWSDAQPGDKQAQEPASALFWNLDAPGDGVPWVFWTFLGGVFLTAAAVVLILIRCRRT